jgi:purine-binding chemotaxis protein CheW
MNAEAKVAGTEKQLVVFSVAELACAVDVDCVQEINKSIDVTPVFQAPDYIRGVINLRGKIVTVIDLRKKLGFEEKVLDRENRIVVVKCGDEPVGILVDGIDDILVANGQELDPVPSNLGAAIRDYFYGVHKTEQQLIALLSPEALLKKDT